MEEDSHEKAQEPQKKIPNTSVLVRLCSTFVPFVLFCGHSVPRCLCGRPCLQSRQRFLRFVYFGEVRLLTQTQSCFNFATRAGFVAFRGERDAQVIAIGR